MPVTPAAVELLQALAAVLYRWGPWYLFGAQAVVAHGVPRQYLRGGVLGLGLLSGALARKRAKATLATGTASL